MKFERGYKKVRELIEKRPKVYMSCSNCQYYYQVIGENEETCNNPSVLPYDLVVEENRIYCIHWKLSKKRENKND